jgi:hypothetical protein
MPGGVGYHTGLQVKAPIGTYLAKTEEDRIYLPQAIAEFVRDAKWAQLLVVAGDEMVTVYPAPYPGVDPSGGFASEMDDHGVIAIGEANRRAVLLNGQGVMVRIEGDVLRIYLRHVFKTLGFRPA